MKTSNQEKIIYSLVKLSHISCNFCIHKIQLKFIYTQFWINWKYQKLLFVLSILIEHYMLYFKIWETYVGKYNIFRYQIQTTRVLYVF